MQPNFRKGRRLKSRLVRMAALMTMVSLLIAGCDSLLAPLIGNVATPTTMTPSQTVVAEPTITAEPVDPIPGVMTITLWLPPQFSPESGTKAGNLLRERLDAYMDANPSVLVVTRVKGASGPGGLLETLSASAAAAPDAMPAIVTLNRSDLEQAALKSLILPLDGLTPAAEDPDWYPYARQLGRVQNSTFGIPFAGDALLLVYRADGTESPPPANWDDVFASKELVIAPMDDSQALFTLALYRSAGGSITNSEGRPTLDPEILTKVLEIYSNGIGRGTFPTWLTQLQTGGQAWQAFNEDRGGMVVSWSSNFLADLPPDAKAAALPTLGNSSYTLATGWSWALADNNPLTREKSVKLMEFLSDSKFLAEWTAAVGYLPTKPAVLNSWENQSLQPALNQVLLASEVRPANELLASLGPVLRESVLSLFSGLASPEQAAQTAAEKLGAP